MYYEIRTYRLKNGAIPGYLKVVGEEGIAIPPGRPFCRKSAT